MHCQSTVDPEGNWMQSWRALEKAYSEGKVNSIGVSNFNIELLNEIAASKNIIPHIVQNNGGLSNLDLILRKFCFDKKIIYQPYATIKNLANADGNVQFIINKLASDRQTSKENMVNKFFIQTGASIIPSSVNSDHLEENLKVFSLAEIKSSDLELLGWNENELEQY